MGCFTNTNYTKNNLVQNRMVVGDFTNTNYEKNVGKFFSAVVGKPNTNYKGCICVDVA